MNKTILLSFFLLLTISVFAQDNNTLSDSYLIKAKESYSNGDLSEALKRLNKSRSYLSKTHAGIEALYVRIYSGLDQYNSAEKHLTRYFKVIPSNKHMDYIDMSNLVFDIKEKAVNERDEIKKQKALAAENEKRRLEKEAQDKIDNAKKEKERKVEVKRVEVETEKLNNLLENENFEQAEKIYKSIRYSDQFISFRVTELDKLKCYMTYNEAKTTGSTSGYTDYLDLNSSRKCSYDEEIKTILKKMSIENGDEFAGLNKYDEAISYYKVYVKYFPDGEKSTYANNQINLLETKKKTDEAKELRKNAVFENREIINFLVSRRYIGMERTVLADKLGYQLGGKMGGLWSNILYSSKNTVDVNFMMIDNFDNVVHDDSEPYYYDIVPFQGGVNPTFYDVSSGFAEIQTYTYQNKVQSVIFSVHGGVNYRVYKGVRLYFNLNVGYIKTSYFYDLDGPDAPGISDFAIDKPSQTGLKVIPEGGLIIPVFDNYLTFGLCKFPEQPVTIALGWGF